MPPIDVYLQKVLDAAPFRLSPEDGVEVARRRLRNLPRPPLIPGLRVENRTISGPGGALPIRIYWPSISSESKRPPAVVAYFHGGGYALGDLDTHDSIAQQHAVGANAVVVSVDYRLAPEHPFPAAVDDGWAALQWISAHATALGADPQLLALAGDSAGGNLAAVMALLARNNGAPPISYQLLWYPFAVLDTSLPSFSENAEAPILDRRAVDIFTRWYAGHVDLAEPPDTLAPGRATSLSGLAPAYVAVAGHDPLRDDGIRYAELLRTAAVPTVLDNAQTLVHGYLGYASIVPAAAEAMARGLSRLRAALRTG
jgi:acetyl esterase/lipase